MFKIEPFKEGPQFYLQRIAKVGWIFGNMHLGPANDILSTQRVSGKFNNNFPDSLQSQNTIISSSCHWD